MKKTLFSLPLEEGGLRGLTRSSDEVSNCASGHKTSPSPKGDTSPKRRGSRRGFTIVEVVIALTVIVLVTGVSIGVVMVDNKAHVETIDMIEATNIAENAVECFRFAVRNGGTDVTNIKKIFDNNLAKSININFDPKKDDEGVNYPFDYNSETNTYTVTNGRVTVTIEADFTNKFIKISAKNGGTNEYLLEPKTYTVR